MHDLESWRWLLNAPQRISFDRMILLGGDFDPPVTEGSGVVNIDSNSQFRFELKSTDVDQEIVDERQQRLRDNPYDSFARFRTQAWDADGRQWHLGWVEPDFVTREGQIIVQGLCEGLSLDIPSTSQTSSTTAVYRLQHIRQLMSLMFATNGHNQSTHVFELGGSTVELTYDPKDSVLLASATHSDTLPPTYTENWLGEPLRILLGHLVFPSLVARDVPGKTMILLLRRTPNMGHTGGIASYFRYVVGLNQRPSFWKSFEALLRWVASARGKDGQPNFESNSTTRLVEEIVQAEYLGSRWILALTLASAVESQAKKLADKVSMSDRLETKRDRDQLIKHIEGWSGGDELKGIAVSAIEIPTSDSQEAEHDRDQLIRHIEEWNGGEGLKGIAVSAINRSVEKTTPKILRALRDSGVVTKDQIAAWQRVRNSVVHGHLISPYSFAEEDSDILAMAKMFHALTDEVIPTVKAP
jgi:hypothetical protein